LRLLLQKLLPPLFLQNIAWKPAVIHRAWIATMMVEIDIQ
jgi:hypothetical protein